MKIKRRDGRQISRDVLEHLRMRAVELIKKGRKVKDVAEDFGVTLKAVYNWVNIYKKKGLAGLKSNKAKGAKPKLDYNEIKHLISCIKKPATEFGYETPLWDCRRIQQLIKGECKKDIHMSNVWRWLRRWEFTPQVPEKRALEQDEKAVRKWLKEEWPKIKAHARRWQAILYFLDECGVSLIPVMGKTWAPKGKTPIVKMTGKRGGICVTSAISFWGRMVFRIEKEKVNANVHIEFLKQIIKHHPYRKIIIVEDKAPPHIAKKVKNFVENNRKVFALYFFPSYSPELNPDEDTWKYLKSKKLKSHQAKSTPELRSLVLSKMRGIQRRPNIIKSFFYNSILY